jgi:N-acetylmuramoyl-L-alanine amidase/putative methionine-R-sulfoxide reductase with GAF domain
MSATPNNAGSGWPGPPPSLPDRNLSAPQEADSGRDALQALLAFACIHEQAAKRRQPLQSVETSPAKEEFGLDEVLQLVAARAVSLTGADGVAIALAEEDAIVCRASVGTIAPEPGVRLDPNSGFSGACLRSGQTVRCDDSETDARVNAQACRALGTRSMVAVPLSAKQRVIGLIEAFSSETYGFNDCDVKSLNLLGELILAAIRPEEEDRLAELARSIIPAAEPQPPEPVQETAAPPPTIPAPKILVDEKFAAKPGPPPAQVVAATPAKPIATLTEVTASAEPEAEKEVVASIISLAKVPRSVSSIVLSAALALVVVVLGGALVLRIRQMRHMEQSISANTQPAPQAKIPLPETPQPKLDATETKPSGTPEVTSINHWTSPQSSTVVVDLQDQVQYEAHALDNPSRIYFDLHDTKMASGLLNQSIEVNDGFLKRIRMAQPSQDVTRVVLETKGDLEFTVKLDSNPFRLTIEVHKPATNAGAGTKPISLNKPSPVVVLAPKDSKNSRESRLSPSDFRIVLDAGHGGWDLGTVGKRGLLEKDLVLDVVERLGRFVQTKLGAEVIYTRQDDSYLPLEKRAEIANLARADLFLSVHANYSDLATARGIETYYTNTYSSIKARTADFTPTLQSVDWTGIDIRDKVSGSRRFAADVQQALYSSLVARNPEIRNRGVKEEQYVVLTGTQMPAVLAEISFLSSPTDEDKLQSSEYRQLIAESLFKGLAKYCEEGKHTKLATARN